MMSGHSERVEFFRALYRQADGNTTLVPWADLAPKQALLDWLRANPGNGLRACDVACGLGDNAEALACAGYQVTGFDVSDRAINWAKERFAESQVNYQQADLFSLPDQWLGEFDLVHECYTIQSFDPDDQQMVAEKIAKTVARGGSLLIYAMAALPNQKRQGPPWPITPDIADIFSDLGFMRNSRTRPQIERKQRIVPHVFDHWVKS